MSETPSTTARNGDSDRARNGRFLPNNKAAKGNPHAKRVGQLRSVMLRTITVADMRAVVRKLVESAKGGDVAASKLLFDRCLGRPDALDVLLRLDELEGNP